MKLKPSQVAIPICRHDLDSDDLEAESYPTVLRRTKHRCGEGKLRSCNNFDGLRGGTCKNDSKPCKVIWYRLVTLGAKVSTDGVWYSAAIVPRSGKTIGSVTLHYFVNGFAICGVQGLPVVSEPNVSEQPRCVNCVLKEASITYVDFP